MKRIAIALVLLIVVVAIAWLAWSSKHTETPSPVAQAPATSAATQPTTAPITSNAPDAARAEVRAEPAPPPATAAPSAPPLDSAEILVHGSVRDEHGKSVPSAGLRWIDVRGNKVGATVTNGEYSIAGMHAGRWIVEVVGVGWHRDQYDAELDPRPELQRRDFTAHANATIRIKVVDPGGAPILGKDSTGRNLPGSRLRAFASWQPPGLVLAPEELKLKAHSDCSDFRSRGELHLDCSDCLGELELSDSPPLFVSLALGCAVVATQPIQEVPPELVFTLSAEKVRSSLCSLRLRAVMADGRTVVTSGMAMLNAQAIESHNLDAEGRAEFKELLPGGYALTLISPGNSKQQRQLVLAPGQALDLGDVVLASAATLEVRLEFPGAEQPLVSLVLKPEVAGDPLATLGALDDSTIGAQGAAAKINFPGAGRYELRVTRIGDHREGESLHLGARPQRVELGDAPAGELVVRILPTTEICMRPPQDSRGVTRWLVSTADGLPCQRVRIEGRAPTRIELVPGEYTIARIEAQALANATPFNVGSEFETVDLQP